MCLSKRLIEERRRLGLSQADFAGRAGVSLSSQKRYELGERKPDTHYLEEVRGIGVDVTYLLTGKRRSQKNEWVDEFHMLMFAESISKVLGITKSDLKTIVGFVETTMRNPPYRSLPSEESMPIYDEMFLMAVSDLVSRKTAYGQKGEIQEIDHSLLTEILIGVESAIGILEVTISPAKKATAISLLYRSFKTSGKINQKTIDDTVRLAAS